MVGMVVRYFSYDEKYLVSDRRLLVRLVVELESSSNSAYNLVKIGAKFLQHGIGFSVMERWNIDTVTVILGECGGCIVDDDRVMLRDTELTDIFAPPYLLQPLVCGELVLG